MLGFLNSNPITRFLWRLFVGLTALLLIALISGFFGQSYTLALQSLSATGVITAAPDQRLPSSPPVLYQCDHGRPQLIDPTWNKGTLSWKIPLPTRQLWIQAQQGLLDKDSLGLWVGPHRFPLKLIASLSACGQDATHPTALFSVTDPATAVGVGTHPIDGLVIDSLLISVVHVLFPWALLGLLGRVALHLKTPSNRPLLVAWPYGLSPHKRTQSSLAWGTLAVLGPLLAALFVVTRTIGGFTQDDNLMQFLPVIMDGCTEVFHGRWPGYTPYTLMGMPVASVGTYAILYPGTWAACALSQGFFGSLIETINVFVPLHLALGGGACYVLARRLGARGSLACAFSNSVCACGFLLAVSRNWFYISPLAVFLPASLCALLACLRRPTAWTSPLTLGGLLALFFYAGNAQLWIFTLCVLGALGALGTRRLQQAYAWIGGLMLGSAGALPLLIVEKAELTGSVRMGGVGTTLDGVWMNIVDPVNPLVQARWGGPIADGSLYTHMFVPFWYYAASFLPLMGIISGLLAIVSIMQTRSLARAWIVCRRQALAILAVALTMVTLPAQFPFGSWLGVLPVFDLFQHLFKWLPFVLLLGMLAGVLLLERVLRQHPSSLGPWFGGMTVALALYGGALARAPFFLCAETAFPLHSILPQPSFLSLTRVMSVGPQRVSDPHWMASLAHNAPAYFHIPAVMGYDPLVQLESSQQDLLHAMLPNQHLPDTGIDNYELQRQAYLNHPAWLLHHGVNTLVVDDGFMHPFDRWVLPHSAVLPYVLKKTSQGKTDIVTLCCADPLVFLTPSHPLPMTRINDGVATAVPDQALQNSSRLLTFNLVWRPFLQATIDGHSVPNRPDAWRRVQIQLPDSHAHTVTLLYQAPWIRGIILGVLLALLSMGTMVQAHWRNGRPS